MAFSYRFVSPSPSASPEAALERIVNVLLAEGVAVELPEELVATAVKEPTVPGASVSVIVAEVPPEPMVTLDAVTAAGVNVGKKAKVAPVRLEPVTWKLLIVVPESTRAGLTELITGLVSTVKLLLDVAVDEPTVTVMGPVVAPVGTVTVRLFGDAALTVATVPLNLTVFEAIVVPKFCPWIVTVCPTGPCEGEKLRIAGVFVDSVDLVMESRFPTASYRA
jgi:hypothetical protein